ncbi:hypothetical protein D3C80_1234910 [compost metagenome]
MRNDVRFLHCVPNEPGCRFSLPDEEWLSPSSHNRSLYWNRFQHRLPAPHSRFEELLRKLLFHPEQNQIRHCQSQLRHVKHNGFLFSYPHKSSLRREWYNRLRLPLRLRYKLAGKFLHFFRSLHFHRCRQKLPDKVLLRPLLILKEKTGFRSSVVSDASGCKHRAASQSRHKRHLPSPKSRYQGAALKEQRFYSQYRYSNLLCKYILHTWGLTRKKAFLLRPLQF